MNQTVVVFKDGTYGAITKTDTIKTKEGVRNVITFDMYNRTAQSIGEARFTQEEVKANQV